MRRKLNVATTCVSLVQKRENWIVRTPHWIENSEKTKWSDRTLSDSKERSCDYKDKDIMLKWRRNILINSSLTLLLCSLYSFTHSTFSLCFPLTPAHSLCFSAHSSYSLHFYSFHFFPHFSHSTSSLAPLLHLLCFFTQSTALLTSLLSLCFFTHFTHSVSPPT